MKKLAMVILKAAAIIVLVNIAFTAFILIAGDLVGGILETILGFVGFIAGLVFSVGVWFIILMVPATIVFIIVKGIKKVTSK